MSREIEKSAVEQEHPGNVDQLHQKVEMLEEKAENIVTGPKIANNDNLKIGNVEEPEQPLQEKMANIVQQADA